MAIAGALAPLRFGTFVLDEAGFTLRRDGQPVEIEPRALRLLLHLARNRQRAVPSAELAAILWPDTAVSEASLKEAVKLARRAVGDVAAAQAVVATLRGHGYRFVAAVDEIEAAEAMAAPAGRPPHFVGRLGELESLRAMSADVGRGTARIVVLEGEAGVGKTTLVRRFAEIASASGYAVVGGQNDSDCGAPPYWMWIQVLRELLARPEIGAVRRRAPNSLAVVKRLVQSEAIGERGVVAAHDRRLWLFDDVAEVVRTFASACPLLILLEDLHAANEDALLLLRFLARHLEATRMLVLGTFRRAALSDDHPLAATLTELRRVPWFTEMVIEGLSEKDTTALVGERVSTSLVHELQRRTRGNPLFLEEILRHAATRFEANWFARDDAAAVLRDLAPPSVRDLVAQRVGGLHPDARAIFDAAAVLGERFEQTDVAHLVGRRAAAIGNDIEALHALGFFQAAPNAVATQFTHPIVREAALSLLSPRRSQELHDKAVKRLERTGANEAARVPQLAYHALAALPLGSIGKAVQHGRAAAAQAASRFAYEDAAALYRETLAAATQRRRASAVERAELLVALAEVAARTEDHEKARDAAIEGFRLAQQQHLPDLCVRAACALGPNLLPLRLGKVDELRVELLEEALRLIPQREKAQRIRLHSELAVALYWSPDSRRCMAVADTAVELARKLRQPATLAHALYARCIAQWRPSAGRSDHAAVREAIRVADRAGEGDLAMACAVRLGHALADAGDLDGLDRLTANLEQRAERLGYPQARMWPLIFQASRLIRQRQLDAAERAIDRVRAAGPQAGGLPGEPHSALLLGLLRLEQGTFEGLVELFDGLATWTTDYSVEAPLPLILAAVGDLESAKRAYQELVTRRPWEASDHMGTIAALSMVAVCAVRFEDAETASGIYRVLEPHAGEYTVIPGVAGLLAPLTRVLGELCGILGRSEQAIAYFERAIEESRRAGLHSDAVRTQLAWARVLAQRDASGDRRRAAALGRAALRRAEALNSGLLIAEAAAFNAAALAPLELTSSRRLGG